MRHCRGLTTAATPVTPGYDYDSGGRLCTEPGQGPANDADSIGHMLRAGYELYQADPYSQHLLLWKGRRLNE